MSLESKKTEQLQLLKLKLPDASLTAVGSYISCSEEDMSALWAPKYRHGKF